MRSSTRYATAVAAACCISLLGCSQDAESPTGPQPQPELAVTALSGLSFTQISAGYLHTCAVTADHLAYCWGKNFTGQLGDGTLTDRLTPVPVARGLHFRSVSAGTAHTCGVTVGNRIYCWGANSSGQLGDGTTADVRLTPVHIGGALYFRQVVAANQHSCGVTLDYRAYCWGTNGFGALGDGTETRRLRPVPVVGGLQFLRVSAALGHTCGVTLANRAYCWGNNSDGTLGNGPPQDKRLTPVAVAGGLLFREVVAGFSHTCGVTTDYRAYCWGESLVGELGDGTSLNQRLTPVPVVGGYRFARIGAVGERITCAVTVHDRAYCWGSNRDGLLGIGYTTGPEVGQFGSFSSRPVAVAGKLPLHQVSARSEHTCGITVDNRTYCWGSNGNGQLGDGTLNASIRPVAVVGAP